MKTKEVLEARWKVLIFALLALLASGGNIASYPLFQPGNGGVSSPLQNQVQVQSAVPFATFVWPHWFETNGPAILAIFAAVLGGGLIANEINKGTIFFLLSKPVSRERILLTKYAVSAGLLLLVSVMGALAIALISSILAHPQDLLRLLVATGLLWLTALFPLGLSLFFSVMSSDSVRPVIFSLLITLMLVLPAIVPGGQEWSLWHYWSNQNAYQTGMFPLKEYLICLFVASIPLFAALIVFHRKAY